MKYSTMDTTIPCTFTSMSVWKLGYSTVIVEFREKAKTAVVYNPTDGG